MRAGTLAHRVIIERPAPSRDDAGSESIVWETYATVWASVEPMTGREGSGNVQVLADLDTIITIRWSPRVDAITAKWRVRQGSTVYNVAAPPAHVSLGEREIRLLCKSGVNDG